MLLLTGCGQSSPVPEASASGSTSAGVYQLDRSGTSPYLGGSGISLDDTKWGKLNEDQILEVTLGGKKVYHPVNSAWWMNQMLSSYRATGDRRYLDPVVNTARYLIRYSVSDRNGTWFKYDFDYTHGKNFTLKAGWVSGMAQGMMLSTFVNLYDATRDPYWKKWADRTFTTFKAPKSTTSPWFTYVEKVDGREFVYFEEYPAPDDQISHVVNGNIYAMYGLYDYYRLTGNDEASSLFNAAATSLRDVFPLYRRPGDASWYAVTDFGRGVWKNPVDYHRGVTSMLRTLGDLTGDPAFYQQSEVLAGDLK